jgi:hypothetical protein
MRSPFIEPERSTTMPRFSGAEATPGLSAPVTEANRYVSPRSPCASEAWPRRPSRASVWPAVKCEGAAPGESGFGSSVPGPVAAGRGGEKGDGTEVHGAFYGQAPESV